MTLPFIPILKQLAQDRLREAVWSAVTAMVLAVAALTSAGLGVAAGIVVTAERVGLVPALLAWAGGFLTVALIIIGARQISHRRRRIRKLELAAARSSSEPSAAEFGASMLSNAAFKAGVDARNRISPLGAVAAAFAVGALIAGTKR
ncbi:hypothetical protein [Thalassobaculum sp.]|uniref:hypothetical protein n=1 Tax=Thalassobaculum sp. TaxID=2022740 RepID=UPI0032ECC765